MIENGERIVEEGYTTDIITDKCIDWIKERDKERPFFMMCHHKAPHRSWEYHPKYDDHYTDEIPYPDSFDDDYSNRAKAALHARMRVESDLTYQDLDLVQPYYPGKDQRYALMHRRTPQMMVPFPKTEAEYEDFKLICRRTGEIFTFANSEELKKFKYQRYMQKYLRTVASIDESIGRLLDMLRRGGPRGEYHGHLHLGPGLFPRRTRLVRQALYLRRVVPHAVSHSLSRRRIAWIGNRLDGE